MQVHIKLRRYIILYIIDNIHSRGRGGSRGGSRGGRGRGGATGRGGSGGLALAAGLGAVGDHVGRVRLALARRGPGLAACVRVLAGGVRGGGDLLLGDLLLGDVVRGGGGGLGGSGSHGLGHGHGEQLAGGAVARDSAGEGQGTHVVLRHRVAHRGRIPKEGSAHQVAAAVGRGLVDVVEEVPLEDEGVPDFC